MKKKVVVWILLLTFQLFKASSQGTIGWWSIDCGSDVPRIEANLIAWSIDKDFTKSGISVRLPERQPLEEMSTLRYFPNQLDKNCYTLPAYAQTLRYLIRAGFYYGNYDFLFHPPTFDLYIDDKIWSTVNTSSTGGPIYQEAMYVTHGSGSISVCLMQTRDGEVPFISSLEAVPLWVNLYPEMETSVTFALVNRTNYGGDEIRFTGSFLEEKYNRIWTRGETPSNSLEVRTAPDSTAIPENDPPNSVLRDSITSLNYPIMFSVHLPPLGTPHRQLFLGIDKQSAYLVFYFTEFAILPNDTRIIDIYIDGKMRHKLATEVNKCKVITLRRETVYGSIINITLAPSKLSTLPPIISAMEVFTRLDYDENSSSIMWDHFSIVYILLIQIFSLVTILNI